jgi:hypothetical protein
MKNNSKIKKKIENIGFDVVLQCLIEIVDDSIIEDKNVPLWKLTLAEHLEYAYDAYMKRERQTVKV